MADKNSNGGQVPEQFASSEQAMISLALWSAEASALHQTGRKDEAEAIYKQILEAQPDHFDSLLVLGVISHQRGDYAQALDYMDRMLALRPDYAEALCDRGVVLYELKRLEDALASYDRALALRPNFVEAQNNRGNALRALERFEEALASYDRVLALDPDHVESRAGRSMALHGLGRFDEVLANVELALAQWPDRAEAHADRGAALFNLKRFEEALASFERACAQRPDLADAHYGEAWCRLLTGDLARGFEKFEWRWQAAAAGVAKWNFPQPLWLGSGEIAGKTILLYSDQGFGDTIQFCRYVPLVATRGGRVMLAVQEPLQALVRTLTGPAQILARDEPVPECDWYCPLLSLPLAFRTELPTIPSATPYLWASEPAVTSWNVRLIEKNRPRIGLAWSGRPTHTDDRNRSIGLGSFVPLLRGIDATFVSLQRDVRPSDAAVLHEHREIVHFGAELKDFADTAALVANLDLVVSVDTSVAHLTGALGKPVWILLPFIPDWRWLLDRNDSPWYPTARLFRQDETRNWEGVIARVNSALADHVRGL